MKVLLSALVLGISWLPSCEEVATNQQIAEMCRTRLRVEGKVDLTPVEVRIEVIKHSTEARFQALESERTMVLGDLDEKRKAELRKTGNVAARRKIAKLYAALEKEKEQEIRSRIGKVKSELGLAMDDARKRAETDQLVATMLFNECVNEAQMSGVTRTAAQCRLKAKALYQYFGCP
jgi:hypothetical protein